MKYEKRIVFFIDLLGFKNLINKTKNADGSDNETEIQKIVNAYNSIRDVWDLDSDKDDKKNLFVTKNSKEITIFSDSIVISFLAKEESEIFYTLLEVKWMIMRLINRNILSRGAVSFGNLIHNDKFVFGPALVEAYTLESKAAIYPRIILDRDIIDLARKAKQSRHSEEQEVEFIESLLEKDLDGMYYIDYFTKAQSELDAPEYDFPDYIQTLEKITKDGLRIDKIDVRAKYIWMKEKYNRMVENIIRNKSSWEPKLKEVDESLCDFYKSLKKIN